MKKKNDNLSSNQKGNCLCGEVSFEVQGEFTLFLFCHCSYCQKDTGSVHGANLISHSAKLTWLSGEKNVTKYNLPKTRHTKCFCCICGSALPYLFEDNMLVLPAGSINFTPAIPPTAHIFYDSRAKWEDELANIKKFATFPDIEK